MTDISQKKLFYDSIKYLKYLKKKNIDHQSSGITYFCTWSKTIGYYKLRFFISKKKLALFFHIIKNFLKIGYFSNFELDFVGNSERKNLFIAWSTNETLNTNLFNSNRYISGFKQERKEGCWFLIHEGEHSKKNKLKNVYLLKRKKIYFNFFFLIKEVIRSVKVNKLSLLKNIHSLNTEFVFSKIVEEKFFKFIKKDKIEKIIISYEAQPFQKNLIKKIKKNFPKIIIYCDIHSLQPSYLHLTDLNYYADFYITHNKDQKDFLVEKLKIKKQKIIQKKIVISNSKNNFYGKIFLPYFLNNFALINESLQFLENKKIIRLKDFSLQPHPVAFTDNFYRSKCLYLKQKYHLKKNSSKKVIIIGNTNILFEALNLNLDVIHITTDFICDTINSFFWKSVERLNLNSNIYIYKLKK